MYLPDCIPLGCGCWAGEGELGVALLDTRMGFVPLTPRGDWSDSCALPMLSVQSLESCPQGELLASESLHPG